MVRRGNGPGRASRVALWALIGCLTAVPAAADIVITEISYDPVDESGTPRPDLEFVEIYNDGPEPFDLTGFRFIDGIDFEFSTAMRRSGEAYLNGRSYLVIARDAQALRDYYGIANVVGDFGGVLDNSGEDVELGNPQGLRVSRVRYNDRGKWPGGAKGTGHTLSLIYEYSEADEPENWALSTQMGGTPGRANFNTDVSFQDSYLIDAGESWRYFKGTQAPPGSWASDGFNDAGWLSGPTGIGYGDGDDATLLDDMQNSYVSVYCRKSFTVDDVDAIDELVLSVIVDDGFVAYLNGSEVASYNMDGGRNWDDTASGTVNDGDFVERNITSRKNLLRVGTNVLAVQVHNTSSGSSDLSFIPRLASRRVILPEDIATVPVVINEGLFLTAGTRFIELHNTSRSAVNLSGYFLTDDFLVLDKYRIADGTSIPAGGFLVFTEAQLGFDLSIAPVLKERVSIALTNSSGRRVVDAFIFEPKHDELSEARVPDGADRFAEAADPTPGAANAVTVVTDVVFNEIMFNPHNSKTVAEKEREEFIEFYNRGDIAVDVSDWEVEGVDFTFPPGTTIQPGAYLVIGGNPDHLAARYDLEPPVLVTAPWAGLLGNRGERLTLKDERGNVADTVRYFDGGDWPFWSDGGGSSLELIDPWADNDIATSWDASDDSDKAVAVTLSYGNVRWGGREHDFGIFLADEGIAIVDDISLTRAGAAELIRNPSFDANTSTWRIEGTHSRSGRTTDPAERLNGAGSLKLVAWGGGGDYKVNRIEAETNSQTTAAHTVRYLARWVVGSNRIITIGDYGVGGNASNPGLAGSRIAPIPLQLGTPGAPNSVTLRQEARFGDANIGPSIDRVSHSPGVPENQETVTVTARVGDPDGVASVRLYYRTEQPTGSFTQGAMSDPEGDGNFTATIPGQSLGIRVLFYVEATDGEGRVSRYPRDLFERTHPPVLDPDSPAANDHLYCMYRHDTRIVSTSGHSFRFILNQQSEDELRTRLVLSNQMLEGTFVFGTGDVYYNSSVRFAGSPWLRPGGGTWGKSYSLQFPRDNPLNGRVLAINLDNHGSDGRERLSHYLLRYAASSTPLPYFAFHDLVRFQLNDVRDSTYEALDKPNRQYMEFWFPDSPMGEFFEMDDRFEFTDGGSKGGNAEGHLRYPPYGATSGGTNPENYRWYFIPRGGFNKTRDDFSGLTNFANLMDPRTATDTRFDQTIWQMADVEEILRVWSIELNIDDWDTWAGNRGKNCYFYRPPHDLLWRKVPWDLELTYGSVNAFSMPSTPTATYGNHFEEIQRMINRPRIKRMYYGILAENVNQSTGFFQSSFLSPYTQRLSSAGVGSMGNAGSGGFIDQRASMIRSWIRTVAYPQVRLRITTNGGSDFTVNGLSADLAGTAPVDIFFITVLRNDDPVDDPTMQVEFSNTSMTSWSIRDIPLGGGTNRITLLGYDSHGLLVDSTSITVTSTVNWDPPAIASIDPGQAAPEDFIDVLGTEFHDGLRVFFGGTEAGSVTFDESDDPTRIVVEIPELSSGPTTLTVRNIDGKESEPIPFTVLPPAPKFVRGDANLDDRVDLSDAVKILAHLFRGLAVTCEDALDANDSGDLNVADAIFALDYIFKGGVEPAAPFPGRGVDPTDADALGCEVGLPR